MRRGGVTRKILTYGMTLILAMCYPYVTMADSQDPTSTPPSSDTSTTTPTTPATDQTPTSTTTPTPAPSTTSTPAPTPAPKPTYTYNAATGHWDSDQWQYNPATGTYEKPPAPVIVTPDTTTTDTSKTVDTTVNVGNGVTSSATSGDAAVSGNTTAGSATSGDAAATATLMNVVNSTIGASDNQKVASFTKDIYGDVTGDIVLSPLLLKAMLEANAPDSAKNTSTVDASTNFNVNNTLNLAATSGNAAVSGNTTAGNATSGSATAVANVVNILNSLIAAQQSFVGTVNIYGNLNGDILIAPDFIPQLLASNGGSDSSTTQVSSQDTETIVNNVSAAAQSGAADVFGNTTAGNATSGNAQSNVVIFNLSGHQIVAQNSLLVFVNALGKWVGVIVDAPAGATAAALGTDVSQDTSYAPDLTVNSQSNYGITNTIAVSATSGDATVANNTTAGNAVSGSAAALANIANISGSQMGLSGWFGVLFINVFQNWYGSFGVDTPYGNPVTTQTTEPSAPIEFRPASNNQQTQVKLHVVSPALAPINAVLASSAVTSAAPTTPTIDPASSQVLGQSVTQTPSDAHDYRLYIIAGSILLIGLSVIGLKRLFS